MFLIGISGKKKSGKDEVCNHLKLRYKTVDRIAFADPVKDEVCKALGITRDELEKDKDIYRGILQWWGTEYRRKLKGDDYWIQQLHKRAMVSEAELIVIPDVRFVNEAEYIHNSGGFLFRMDRAIFDHGIRQEEWGVRDHHASETSLDEYRKFDHIIKNHGTLTQLYQEVDIALEMFGLTR